MKTIYYPMLAIAVFCFTASAQLTSPPPAEVIKAAHDNFIPFLTGAVTEETKQLLGFAPDDRLDRAVLGTPLQLFSLGTGAIEQYNGTAPLESLLTGTDLWYFPILLDERIRLILYVGKENGQWMRAGIGSAGLAVNLQEITAHWNSVDGYTPVLVQQPSIGVYLFSIPQIDAYNLTETDAVPVGGNLGKKKAGLSPLGTTIANLRGRISR